MARLAALISLIVMLAGCGGGSSSADPAPRPAAVTVSGQVTFDFVPVVPARGLDLRRDGRASCARPSPSSCCKTAPSPPARRRTQRATIRSATSAPTPMLRCACGPRCCVSERRAGISASSTTSTAMRCIRSPAPCSTRALRTSRGICMPPPAGRERRTRRRARPRRSRSSTWPTTPLQLVLTAAPSTAFPALRFNWSTQNVPVAGTGPGEIGSSRYRPSAGHLSRRRGRSRYRRVRPARHRARVRSLSRASVLALRQLRWPARADGSDRLPCRLRRSLGQRIRGDGDGAARLRRRAQRGSGASVQLRSRATAGPRESESRLVQ